MSATFEGSPPPAVRPSPPRPGPAARDTPSVSSAGGFAHYRHLLRADLYRITGHAGVGAFVRRMLSGDAFRYNVWLRTCQYARSNPWLRFTVYPVAWAMHRRLSWKLGISIPSSTRIGAGLYIGHFGGIVVNHKAVIGKNCNLSHGVTIGKANRGRSKGYPTLGDNVFIGPGAVIVGNVRIGNNVAIGANSVVTRDVPDNAVVMGVPGRVVSLAGAAGYVNRTDYDAPARRAG